MVGDASQTAGDVNGILVLGFSEHGGMSIYVGGNILSLTGNVVTLPIVSLTFPVTLNGKKQSESISCTALNNL